MTFIERMRGWLGRGRADGAPERLPKPDEVVLIARPNGEPEAQMLREMLAQEGIAAMVRNRDGATAPTGAFGPSWAYELWVMRKHARHAREVIGVAEDE